MDVRDVSRVYRPTPDLEVRALDGVTLRIQRGEHVAIMGTSGSGKSTLMHVLGCLDAPSGGRYLLDGVDMADMDEDGLSDLRNRKIGFVFQAFNLVPRTSAVANVELPLAYAGLSRADRRRRAIAALRAVGMGERLDHLPSELSGGQQQRVAVARAIVTDPPLVLADEPTGNLDSRSTEDVLEIFDDLHRQGRTVVLITHEDEVADRAQRVIRLGDGRILSDTRNADSAPVVRGAHRTDGHPVGASTVGAGRASATPGHAAAGTAPHPVGARPVGAGPARAATSTARDRRSA
ncbi:ABC transporter ATP-binding protein [Patulibacter sp. NPDC049589]|uniref:ABC transporter ATP-binding protein n=1 Tax=Patulibacter sp. NPDC049589 TaxID=3154731 RepID=UPI003430CC94